ncbi:SGNH/GDSL hydrolase family protein [Deinococcus alpinitundrae]|uniref:SGNH/GDSL hydrolase family protein n=1 Tax=Deinococcus alpinitundrae TaxID=468913 RepID=UPI00137B4A41|nr:SGNH/GDSL hydrolase family protein [Deinococcus alpinitundrae]
MRTFRFVVLRGVSILAFFLLLITAWFLWQANKPIPADATYVALGSSFAAGPGILPYANDDAQLCTQSSLNYPHLIARRLNLKLADRTCSGAQTTNLLDRGQFLQHRQLDAVNARARLVTITIGGNDVNYIGNLYAWSCQVQPKAVPRLLASSVCKTQAASAIEPRFQALPAQFDRIFTEIHQRAPGAQVIVVDYLPIVPAQGSCTELALDDVHRREARQVAARLAAITATATARNHATLVRASELGRGHEVCSADPWVQGFVWFSNLLAPEHAAYHPNIKGMTALAQAIEQAVRLEHGRSDKRTERGGRSVNGCKLSVSS